MRVILAAGGTAGHIEPALNLADALVRLDPSVEVVVLGGTRGMESELVPARGYRLVTVESVPMPRRISVDLLLVGPRLRRAVVEATRLLEAMGPDVVVGFGGYAAMPAYRAAHRLHIPLVVHEANARPGLANRLAARWTTHVFTCVPGTIRGAAPIGLPLRRAISSMDRGAMRAEGRAAFGLDPEAPVLLVFGGSQGATRLNAVVEEVIDEVVASGAQVLHAYGRRNSPPAPRAGYVAVPYLERMDLAYAAADLAVVRGGAMTCAELAAVGLPGVYVPLPIGNGEQRLNALPVVEAGGGLLVDNAELTPEWLARNALPLLHDERRLAEMARAARAHGVRDADEQLAMIVLDIAGRGLAR